MAARLSPWFLGQAERGLTLKQAQVTLGPSIPLAVKAGEKPHPMRPSILTAYGALVRQTAGVVVDGLGRVNPGYWVGTRGVGWVWPRANTPEGKHVIPVAVFSPTEVTLLVPDGEAQSRALVGAKGLPEVLPQLRRMLPRGLAPQQELLTPEPTPSTTGRTVLVAGGILTTLAAVAGGLYAFAR